MNLLSLEQAQKSYGEKVLLKQANFYLNEGEKVGIIGINGTGKTTLSTDPKRLLIGDDEHGWDDNGVFNFEGGCYAKVINLDKDSEPDIYNAIRRNALLENVTLDAEGKIDLTRAKPLVMMMVGVNGAGKTTSIGKISKWLSSQGKSVLLAAGDTFRAAAREQLAVWGERNRVEVISQTGGDPAAVAFDAVSAGKARGSDVVIVDTAGRLTTQTRLMEELKRIARSQNKSMEGAPHEVILVIDGTNGQNALAQVKAFDEAVPLSGLIITKLDGTAKGGVLVAISRMRANKPIPIYFIGVGESIEDLQPFNAEEFAKALIG